MAGQEGDKEGRPLDLQQERQDAHSRPKGATCSHLELIVFSVNGKIDLESPGAFIFNFMLA